MNDKEFLNKYEELLNKDYCNCNEMNCIDNNSPRRILNIAKRQQEEIERLNNRIKKAIDFLKENACIDEDMEYFCDDLRYDDCKTLLEILRGVDKE